MNPLECLESKREEIYTQYCRVLSVSFGSCKSKSGSYKFDKQKEADLIKIKELLDSYEVTILTLKAMNQFEYLAEI